MGSNYGKGSAYADAEGLDTLIAKLGIVQDRLKTPGPVLRQIANLFEVMEAQRFADGGPAPEFGIGGAWAPLAASTIKRRGQPSGSGGSKVLVGLGFLQAAARAPQYTSIDLFAKEITLSINPGNKGARLHNGVNYGIPHETGITNNGAPQRMFVEITPEFRLMSKEIAKNYFLEPFGMDIPLPGAARITNKPPMGSEASAKGYATHQHRLNTGGAIDHRTTTSHNLQNEFHSVQAAHVTGDTSQFTNKSAFNAANKRVSRYLSTAPIRNGK